ncbi:MAG: glutamine-hydrolyzing GMP synthase [Oscillospiraceae bacterium]|nr:glutamine-hydrolyzing GMP synthase [Oscillospiraceae bacterium]
MDSVDKILVLDFGGQYNQLIARRVRAEQVYAEIKPYNKITPEEIKETGYKGIIFTGGPNSVYDKESPHYDPAVLNLGIPILGICYGEQLMAYMAGGEIAPAENGSEYGKTAVFTEKNVLFEGVPEESVCWMSHTDYVKKLPEGFIASAHTEKCPSAAICDEKRKLYGVQFHPEVTHTVYGKQILHNFVFSVCGCKAEWKMENFVESSVEKYKNELAGKKVLLALSGGVDSSVAAVLLHKAIGKNLTCVFVDHGLLRKGEGDFVEHTFGKQFGINLIRVNAEERFLSKLKGVTEPEKKRKIIGEEFIRVFEDVAKKLGKTDVLAQGTIYPDVIESGKGDSAVIKSHHNVGGLPDVIAFDKIVEPLRDLFKDEVRKTGTQLGIPSELVWRQPFPGPGLAVRVIGEITKEKLELLREADAIFREEVAKSQLENNPNQYFAVLTDLRSVGVMGDARTYGYTVALRAVTTDDFMTAEWTRLPYEVLEKASGRITNEIKGVTRVVYDITSKPPATVEWE